MWIEDPHLQFIGCDADEQLLRFVKAWGPLTLSGEDLQRGFCYNSIEGYRVFQSRLKAIVGLLGSFKSNEQGRESLQAFIRAEFEWNRFLGHSPETDFVIVGLKSRHNITGDVFNWVVEAQPADLWSAIAFVVQTAPLGTTPSLRCTRRSGKPIVKAHWNVDSLEQALSWMVWYDEFTQNPLICCHACRKVFRPQTAHVRKYCSYDCAHRVAAREWQRKQRKLKKGGA
jgi:hypothetical protein